MFSNNNQTINSLAEQFARQKQERDQRKAQELNKAARDRKFAFLREA